MTPRQNDAAIMAFTTILALAGGGVAADPAPSPTPAPAPPAKQACFYSRDIYNFVAVDDRTVNIRVNLKDDYRLDLFTDCIGIRWSESIAVISHIGSFICTGEANNVDLFVHTTIGPLRCPVSNIHKLTPEEISALPRKQRP
jgi:hypothetical protein